MKHGGAGYAYQQGCRCEVCREAENARHRELRAVRTAAVAVRTDLKDQYQDQYDDAGRANGSTATYAERPVDLRTSDPSAETRQI